MNQHKNFLLFVMLMAFASLTATVAIASSAEVIGEEYTFQADDQLGKLAEKYYGVPSAYPAIIEATNAWAAQNSEYTPIADPARILIGQKLAIPPIEEIPQTFLTEAPHQESVAPEEAIIHQVPSEEQLKLLAGLDVKGIPPELHNEVWLNSEPLKLADLRGKVVLVEFWTFG